MPAPKSVAKSRLNASTVMPRKRPSSAAARSPLHDATELLIVALDPCTVVVEPDSGTLTVPTGCMARSTLSSPLPYTASTPGVPRSVAVCSRMAATWPALSCGHAPSSSAAAPDTMGAAIEVPLMYA